MLAGEEKLELLQMGGNNPEAVRSIFLSCI